MLSAFRRWDVPQLALVGVAAGTVGMILWLTRGNTFFYDDWDVFQAAGGVETDGLGALVGFHSGHFPILFYGLYYGLLELFGAESYFPFRMMIALAHAGVVVLVFIYVRQRASAYAALAAAVLIAAFGSGWQVILWGAGVTFVFPVLAGIAALLLLDRARHRGSRGALIGTAAVVFAALGVSAVGIPVAIAASIEATRRGPARLARIASTWVPTLCFAAVYLVAALRDRESSGAAVDLDASMGYVVHAALSAAAGIIRGNDAQGAILLAVLVVLLARVVIRVRRLPVRVLSVAAVPSALWVLTSISRLELAEPGASRYLYVGGVWILLLGFELIYQGRGSDRPMSNTSTAPWIVIVALVLVPQVELLRNGAGGLRSDAQEAMASLGAMETFRDSTPSDFSVDARLLPQIDPDAYFAAVDQFGSPAATLAEVPSMMPVARSAADEVIFELTEPEVEPRDPGASCRLADPGEDLAVGDSFIVSAPDGVAMSERAFADEFPSEASLVLPPGTWLVTYPSEVGELLPPLHVRIGEGSAALCE